MKFAKEVELDHGDIHAIGYPDGARLITEWGRPLGLRPGSPPLHRFRDVTYVPSYWISFERFAGALYDGEGRRIDPACIRRGRDDVNTCLEPSVLPSRDVTAERVPGRVLYLGYVVSHYGHFLLESLSRWWPLRQRRDQFDAFLVHVPSPLVMKSPNVQAFLRLAGIRPEQVLPFDRPLRIDDLEVPEAAVQVRSHAYQEYAEFTRFLGRSYHCVEPSEQPLYLSRTALRHGVRRYRGEGSLERRLQARGARIFHPQHHTVEEQIRAVNEHRRIIGPTGSAMHGSVFATGRRTLVHVAPREVNVNYLIVDRCSGHEACYLWGGSGSGALARWGDTRRARLRAWAEQRGWIKPAFKLEARINVARVVRELDALGVL